MDEQKKQAYSTGLIVLFLLAVLTIGEYFVGAVAYEWAAVLIGIAAVKAFFVLRDYMHIGRLFGAEEEETQ